MAATTPTRPTRPAQAVVLDREKLGAARYRAAYEFPYFAHALFALTPIACDTLPMATMAVDDRWRLYVDPGFLDAHPVEELAAVLVHETLHCLFDHGGRAETLAVSDHHLWNLACDAAINEILATQAGSSGEPVALPGDPVRPESLGFDDTTLTAEVMYQALLEARNAQTPAGPSPRDQAGRPQAPTAPGAGEDGDPSEPADAVPDDTGATGTGNCECGSAAHGVARAWEQDTDDDRPEGLNATEAELVRLRAADAIAGGVSGDHAPGAMVVGIARWAQRLLQPTVDWRRALAGAVRSGIATTIGQVTPTYARPSRRSAATNGIILPAMRKPLAQVAVIIDTSASMDQGAIEAAVAEVAGIARRAGIRGRHLRLWACDADAVEIAHGNRLEDLELVGGGGTDLRVGFDLALADPRWRPDVVVALTDGYTPWPPRPPAARTIVGLIGTETGTDVPSWATTVHIPSGDEQ